MLIAHTKIGFRALRDMIGLTRDDLAAALNVCTDTIKRWGGSNSNYMPPMIAWGYLEEQRALQIDRELDAVGMARDYCGAVPVPLYDSQEHYEANWRDAAVVRDDSGHWTVANATSMHVAQRLEAEGIDFEFVRPEA